MIINKDILKSNIDQKIFVVILLFKITNINNMLIFKIINYLNNKNKDICYSYKNERK